MPSTFTYEYIINSKLTSIPTFPITLSKDDWGVHSPSKHKVFRFQQKPFSVSVSQDPKGHDDFLLGTPFCLFSLEPLNRPQKAAFCGEANLWHCRLTTDLQQIGHDHTRQMTIHTNSSTVKTGIASWQESLKNGLWNNPAPQELLHDQDPGKNCEIISSSNPETSFINMGNFSPGFTNIAIAGKSPSWIGNTSTQMVDYLQPAMLDYWSVYIIPINKQLFFYQALAAFACSSSLFFFRSLAWPRLAGMGQNIALLKLAALRETCHPKESWIGPLLFDVNILDIMEWMW